MAHTFSNLLTHVIFSTEDIRNQEQHHRKVSFQEEFITFLKRNGIAYDERYIWE